MTESKAIKTNNEIEILEENSTSYFYIILKRFFDIILSIVGLVVLSPFLVLISIIIKLTSKGPVIFAHNRLGKNGEVIKVYKFRTMVSDAEKLIQSLPADKKKEFYKNFKIENDPRITKLGNYLRKTSLDELPQLFNIICGNMSIVGPRPIIMDELPKYGIYADKFLSVTPGLTGNWQANGRSDTTYEERVALDMEYIDNRSLYMDFMIILKTFGAVLKKTGAE